MIKPLIKYTGGKYSEFEKIKQYFPAEINNYFEPFFGGGGVFFRLHNNNQINGTSHINDISNTLIEFYQCVGDEDFAAELYKISNAWDFIRDFGEDFFTNYGDRFFELMITKKDEDFITDEIDKYVKDYLTGISLNLHGFSLYEKVISSLNSKLSRFRKKNITEEEVDLPYKCITTCICQAFYFIIRDMYNDWNNNGNKSSYTKNERSAQWVFIREFCFGSMFRFGKNGNFNIPYGGFGYNKKCFTCKIENIVAEETINLFKTVNVNCKDFESILNEWTYSDNDFMFLDPPYDSTFSEYDDNAFTREDHKRLAECLTKCKCKWLMAISKTDFILDLYKGFHIIEYDKTYMYQAKGDYDSKHTTHLVITNYPINKLVNDKNL